eukprot:4235081-Pyramimonas_sp.AAC.2
MAVVPTRKPPNHKDHPPPHLALQRVPIHYTIRLGYAMLRHAMICYAMLCYTMSSPTLGEPTVHRTHKLGYAML